MQEVPRSIVLSQQRENFLRLGGSSDQSFSLEPPPGIVADDAVHLGDHFACTVIGSAGKRARIAIKGPGSSSLEDFALPEHFSQNQLPQVCGYFV